MIELSPNRFGSSLGPGAADSPGTSNSPKTVVILQSNYLPWRGYFDLMRRCDVFVLYDIVQYTREDWRNRNIIKTRSGLRWLTVPVRHDPLGTTPIDQATVSDRRWASLHIETLRHSYSRAAAFDEVSPWLFDLIKSVSGEPLLSRINAKLLAAIASRLGIATPINSCTELLPRDTLLAMDRVTRLFAICEQVRAKRILLGPAAKTYLCESQFRDRGIEVNWMSYEGYMPYPQLWGPFEPKVSVVDLILNTGATASTYLPRL